MKGPVLLSLLLALLVGLAARAEDKKTPEALLPVPQSAPVQPVSEIKAATLNHPRLVIKNGKHFTVLDENGLMSGDNNSGCGLYRDDTRYLSEWNISLNDEPLTLLAANCEYGYAGRFLYGNKAARDTKGERMVPEQSIFVQRDIVITDAVRERIVLTNFGSKPVELKLAIKYGADFADMFEVRGQVRKHRGHLIEPAIDRDRNQVVLAYRGLDEQIMKTAIAFSRQKPEALTDNLATFKISINPKDVSILEAAIATNCGEPMATLLDDDSVPEANKKYTFVAQKRRADQDYLVWRANCMAITTDNPDFDRLMERNFRDLYILRQPTPKGECVAAGIPWYSVAFGRDEEITAHETLPFMLETTKEILTVLASYQGTKSDEFTEERPGKIMHELRLGEMARCKEIPFVPYYGTVDATPLWLCLLSQYVDWSGDLDFAKRYWPNVENALKYLDSETADSHYLTYGNNSNNNKTSALSNQGWKDSADSVMHMTGELAKPPIALSEVQGYLYEAWVKTAHLATLVGHPERSNALLSKADDLKRRFQTDFWMPDKRYFCLALDGEGKQCHVSASNPGQALATGIMTVDQGGFVADKLNNPEFSSGWGIRTLSAFERAFNPLSYHNGSIWPHDNALIVEGLCAVGRKKEAGTIAGAIFDLAANQHEYRLPELLCGFSRNYSERPVSYPVSCSPQAWAAGSMFLMVDSLLGLKADAVNHKLEIAKPMLPPWLNRVTLKGVRVGQAKVDLRFVRAGDGVKCDVLNNTNELTVVVEP